MKAKISKRGQVRLIVGTTHEVYMPPTEETLRWIHSATTREPRHVFWQEPGDRGLTFHAALDDGTKVDQSDELGRRIWNKMRREAARKFGLRASGERQLRGAGRGNRGLGGR